MPKILCLVYGGWRLFALTDEVRDGMNCRELLMLGVGGAIGE